MEQKLCGQPVTVILYLLLITYILTNVTALFTGIEIVSLMGLAADFLCVGALMKNEYYKIIIAYVIFIILELTNIVYIAVITVNMQIKFGNNGAVTALQAVVAIMTVLYVTTVAIFGSRIQYLKHERYTESK